jgi:ribosome-binding factor A
MPRDFSRADRVADAVQRELAKLLRDEMRDPRVGMVNITAVEVSKDMSSARVYVNFVTGKSQDEAQESIAVLNGAAGFLRTQLAKQIRLRIVPRMKFYFDGSGERGQHLSALIDYAVSRDRSRQAEDDTSGSDGEE